MVFLAETTFPNRAERCVRMLQKHFLDNFAVDPEDIPLVVHQAGLFFWIVLNDPEATDWNTSDLSAFAKGYLIALAEVSDDINGNLETVAA
jgi:hypothetical protein